MPLLGAVLQSLGAVRNRRRCPRRGHRGLALEKRDYIAKQHELGCGVAGFAGEIRGLPRVALEVKRLPLAEAVGGIESKLVARVADHRRQHRRVPGCAAVGIPELR